MISNAAGQAMTVIAGIEHHREQASDPEFWSSMLKQVVLELGQDVNEQVAARIRDIIYAQWKMTEREMTPGERYEAALERHSEAAEDLGRKRQAYGKSIREAEKEYEAARAALAEFEASPGIPKPEFTERPTVAEEERSLTEFEQRKLAETRKFENVFATAGCEGVEVLSVERDEEGRLVLLRLPRAGKTTIATLRGAAGAIGVILRLHPGRIEFQDRPRHPGSVVVRRPGEVLMRLRETGVSDGHGNDDS